MSKNSRRAPVLSFDSALELVAAKRETGQSIVFTNGCFDILHPGHLEILEKASLMGDFLVVGVNTDGSVERLKGAERPVQTLNSRTAILSCIRFVDCVVPFEQDTPQNLISLLLPDVLVKGGDYEVETVVGAEEVIRNGGRVEIVSLLKGFSTTDILKGFR